GPRRARPPRRRRLPARRDRRADGHCARHVEGPPAPCAPVVEGGAETMTHSPHVTHLLPDYVDDLLAPAERAAVEAHLDGCPACRTELEASRRLLADLAALPREVAPPRDLWDGIAARLEAPVAPTTADLAARRNGQAPRPAPSRAPRVRVPRRMRWLAAGLAVVLVAGVGVWRAGVFG